MNIVKIRETAKEMHKAGAISQKFLDKLLRAPVFLYSDMPAWTDDEIKWAEDNILGGEDGIVPVKMPFQNFIICCEKDGNDPLTNTSVYYVVGGKTVVNTVKGNVECMLYVVETQKDDYDGNHYWIATGFTGRVHEGVCANLYLNGKAHGVSERKREKVKKTASCIRSVVTRVSFDVMSKASAVVKVSPKPRPDKGVEWHLSRTHYCVLSKKQAMHIRDKGGGITRHQESRAAHWRRAHFRTLRSERFKGKRNQRIPVIEAWVGPDEWIGNDGKIYKVIL